MEKRASNTFVGGLNTDRHPLTSQNTELIDAQNIDLIAVGEGYQLILQKREGNEIVLYNEGGGGLPIGYIPLAVEEFNNIAYILSVNPATGEGEIGTFPSPDYTEFKFEKTTEIPGVCTIQAGTYDPRVNPPDYEFTITGVAGSGSDETISSDTPMYTLVNGGFTLKNTGLLADEFILTTDETGGTMLFVDGTFFDVNAETVSLGPGSSAVITFKHIEPFTEVGSLPYYPPLVVYDVNVTVTSLNNPVLTTLPYNYKYHIASMLQAAFSALPTEPSVSNVGGPPITASHRVSNAGGFTQFVWLTNDAAVGSVTTNPLAIFPGGVVPGDSIAIFGNAVEVTFAANPIPAYRHTVSLVMTANVNGASVSLYAEQNPM